ncbi:MAG TPA: flagellar motor switch protein FliM [Rhodothermales bacterium]|nr:flagellar motor switch protein FliM [Rhodothermales bacterium]
MAKPPNQKDNDTMLLGQPAGRVDLFSEEERVRPYNFKRPRLFAQDQMRTLSHVHEAFARDVAVFLSAQFRTTVGVTLSAIDQVLYSEFVQSSAPPAALYIVLAKELDQKMVLEIDPRLAVFTVERLLGGLGGFPDFTREVTQIEQRIMGKLIARKLTKLGEAWSQLHPVTFEEVGFESNAEFVQVAPGVESAFVATFELLLYDEVTTLNLCYPYTLLERLLGRSGTKPWSSTPAASESAPVRREYEDRLRNVAVELRAELGRTGLSLIELAGLQEGDVVPLPHRVEEPVRLFVGAQERFRAAPGRNGTRSALRITDVLTAPLSYADDPA